MQGNIRAGHRHYYHATFSLLPRVVHQQILRDECSGSHDRRSQVQFVGQRERILRANEGCSRSLCVQNFTKTFGREGTLEPLTSVYSLPLLKKPPTVRRVPRIWIVGLLCFSLGIFFS